MAKNTSIYVCSNCGSEFPKWSGQCPSCLEWNTLEEASFLREEQKTQRSSSSPAELEVLSAVSIEENSRISSGFTELDRVLGSSALESAGKKLAGFVNSEVILISGDPGIGKSTLLLQTLYNLAKQGFKTVYVSAEESKGQIALRARRILGPLGDMENFKIVNSYDVDSIIAALEKEKCDFVVVDSIQTVSTMETRGISGGMAQVKASTVKLVNYAKSNNVVMLIVGHITKEGYVAGPKTLEHLVDAVLQIEGEESQGYRLIRSLKNRFGTTNEVGILSMGEKGLADIKDAGDFFVSKEDAEGVCRSAVMEGNRVIVVEIQALTNSTTFVQPKRVADGISLSKLQVICAILQKHAKLNLFDKDVYVNIAGGLRLKDPSIDLAIAMAIASSIKSKKLSSKTAVLGELSLTGRVGSVTRSESRKKELKRLGYSKIIDVVNYTNVSDFVRNL